MPTNIIGESFKPYVKTQIETRQKKLSLVSNRDPDLLKYINNKTSWVRLSSGVDVTADKARELDMPNLSGNTLAKQSVLFSARKSGEFTSGVGYTLPNPSYGYAPGVGHGSIDFNYGLIPPAGIISANIRPLSQGSLREATVQITCHNLPQFKTIEALYLRLGYSMLLEWGHTFWYDNKGTLHSDLPDWIYEGFIKGDYSQDGILEILEQQRVYTCGNYDAFFGRVVNFSWSFRPDGGYDITVNLRAVGDVIESFKINVNLPSSTTQSTVTSKSESPQPPVIANKDKSTLHKILFSIAKELEPQQNNGRYLNGFAEPGRVNLSTPEIIRITKQHAKFDLGKANYQDPNEINDKANNILTYQEGYMAVFTSITSDSNEGDSGGNFYYIKLGTLLRIIESFLLKYDTTKEKNGSYPPLFYIDHDFDTNICLTIPRQISLDPHVCLLPPGSLTQTGTANVTSLPKQYVRITYRKVVPDFTTQLISSNPIYFEKLPEETITETEVADPSLIVSEVKENTSGEVITSLDVTFGPNNNKYFESGGGKRIEADSVFGDLFPENGEILVFYQDVDALNTNPIEYTFDNGGQENQGNLGRILTSYRVNNYPFLGKFMHLHINLDYIASTLSNNIDNEGKLSLLGFLQNIASGISKATGEINNFSVTYDEIENLFSFRDSNIPPDGHKYLKQIRPELEIDIIPTRFNVNLLKLTDGSFVKDLSIKSELDNSFATQITVGAQANGNKIGENSTALSKLNIGFEDRIIPVKSSWIDSTSKDSTSPSGSKSPNEIYAEQLLAYAALKSNINSGNVTEEDISNNTQAVVDMYQYHLGYATQKGEIAGVGFIPINLQLTIDGLSGPRLFETYTINDEILPTNYQNNIKFIIRGINHTIDNTGWITTLESFSAPRRDVLTQHILLTDPEFSTPSPNQPGTIVSFASFQSANGTNANQLRAVMASLGYAEKQKQLDDSGSDITQEIAEVGAQVLKTIKANYPSLFITVNAGRDNWHKTKSPNSYHNTGKAIDFKINLVRGDLVKGGAVIGSYTSTEIKILNDIEGILKGIQKTNPKLTYIDEYRNPSDRATGGHFHIAVK